MAEVLIVEDEFLVALDLEDIIFQAGHGIVGIVADKRGMSAICAAPKVALVDLNLRDGRTGPEIARELAEKFGTMIIFVTANPDQIESPPPTALGYIRKPFNHDDVLGALNLALGKATGERPRGLFPLA